MGLSIKVWNNLRPIENETDGSLVIIELLEFKDRFKNLRPGKYDANLIKSYYSYPYSMHKEFRDYLAQIFTLTFEEVVTNSEKYTRLPFFELINFPDNESCMDWETAQKLHQDFVHYKNHAFKVLPNEYHDIYNQWTEIFELAKENGVVEFR